MTTSTPNSSPSTANPPVARGLFALLTLATLACASFSTWAMVLLAAEQWTALEPEIYTGLLQFLRRGVVA